MFPSRLTPTHQPQLTGGATCDSNEFGQRPRSFDASLGHETFRKWLSGSNTSQTLVYIAPPVTSYLKHEDKLLISDEWGVENGLKIDGRSPYSGFHPNVSKFERISWKCDEKMSIYARLHLLLHCDTMRWRRMRASTTPVVLLCWN